jgi:inward rectifier potassium channel
MKNFRKPPRIAEDENDLGFGSRISQDAKRRLLNRDGTFNVEREGLSIAQTNSFYHWLITMSWTKFHLLLASSFLGLNILFAFGYYVCGADALNGMDVTSFGNKFWNYIFFSVQTFASVGYGALNPRNFPANALAAFESFFGLLSVAVATGLLFARFSLPNAKILFSNTAVVAPFREGRAFMFRIVNLRSSQLLQVEVEVIFSRMENDGENRIRRYQKLHLERDKVMFFPLHWTIVHYIDEESPLRTLTAHDLENSEAEFMILVNAVDETYAQTVYSRSSYRCQEIVWGAKFKNMFHEEKGKGVAGVITDRLHEYELVPMD